MPAWLARLCADLQLVDAISELDGEGNDGDDARRSRQPVHCKYELMGNWEDDNNHSRAMALSALQEIAHEAELRLSRPVGRKSQLQPAGLGCLHLEATNGHSVVTIILIFIQSSLDIERE